jgi:hypothetical protein
MQLQPFFLLQGCQPLQVFILSCRELTKVGNPFHPEQLSIIFFPLSKTFLVCPRYTSTHAVRLCY